MTITAIYKYDVILKISNKSYGKLYLNGMSRGNNSKTICYTNDNNTINVVPTADSGEIQTSSGHYYYDFRNWTEGQTTYDTQTVSIPHKDATYTANIERGNQSLLKIE